MSKNEQKQKKKKERERRVAKQKLAATAARRAQEKSSTEPNEAQPDRAKIMTGGVKKVERRNDYVATQKKSPMTQRRSGG